MQNKPQQIDRLQLIKNMQARGELANVGAVTREGYRKVPIDRLVEDPRNERKRFDNLEGMIESIRQFGILEPITVKPIDDDARTGRYQILTGHRRYRAAKSAGVEMVEIIVRESFDDAKNRVKSIISNVQREAVNPLDMAEALKSLIDDNQVATQQELAQLIGKPKSWVSDMLNILTLPAKLQKKVQHAELSIPYDSLIRIARIKRDDQKEEFVRMLLSGASNTQIRKHIAAVAGKKLPIRDDNDGFKPKRSFFTPEIAMVIVQSKNTEELTDERVLAALENAADQLRMKIQSETAESIAA